MQKTENFVGSQTDYLRDVIVANETECELACLLDPECTAVSSIKIWVTYRCLLYDRVDPWSLMPNENSNFFGKICRNGKFPMFSLILDIEVVPGQNS